MYLKRIFRLPTLSLQACWTFQGFDHEPKHLTRNLKLEKVDSRTLKRVDQALTLMLHIKLGIGIEASVSYTVKSLKYPGSKHLYMRLLSQVPVPKVS